MSAAGWLIVVAGIAGILCVFAVISRGKDSSRRKRDVDETADENPYFACDVAAASESRAKDRRVRERRCKGDEGAADAFRFAPELFEHRAEVIEELEAQGFSWLSHYSSVDCLHDRYGLEVCGIHERDDAQNILKVLVRMFPDWKPG